MPNKLFSSIYKEPNKNREEKSHTDAFISYSRKDKEFVRKLYENLNSKNLVIWVDWEDIPIGVKWWDKIKEGIESANIFIVILSPDFLASPWCNKEAEYAYTIGKKVLPIICRDVNDAHFNDRNEIHQQLKKYNWLWLTQKNDFNQSFNKLIEAIKTDFEYVKKHTEYLQQSLKWKINKKHNDYLTLKGKALIEAKKWLKEAQQKESQKSSNKEQKIKNSDLIDIQIIYIEECQNSQKKYRIRLTISVIISIIVVFILIILILKYNEQNKIKNEINQSKMLVSQGKFLEALKTALEAYNDTTNTNFPLVEDETTTQDTQLNLTQILISQVGENNKIDDEDKSNIIVISRPNGKKLISGGSNGKLAIWDIDPTTGALTHKRSQPFRNKNCKENTNTELLQNDIYTIAITPDDKTLVSSGSDGTIKIANLDNLKNNKIKNDNILDYPIINNNKLINNNKPECTHRFLSLVTDNKTLLSGDSNGKIGIWSLETKKLLQSLTSNQGRIKSLAISPDEKILVSGGSDNTIKIWDLERLKNNQEHKHKYQLDNLSSISTLVITPNGKKIVSGGADNTIKIWDLKGLKDNQVPNYNLKGHTHRISSLVVTNDSKKLISGSDDGTIKIWDLEDKGRLLQSLIPNQGRIKSLAIKIGSKGELFLFSSGSNKQIKAWKLHPVNPIDNYTNQVNKVIISSDNKTIVSGSFDGTIRVYDLKNIDPLKLNLSTILKNVHHGWVYTLAISPDNKTLVSGGADNTIKIWDLERLKKNQEPKLKYTLTNHTDKVSTLVITPDGKQLISGSHDKKINIWDLKGLKDNQEPKLNLEGHKDWISSLAVTQDNQLLFSGSLDGTIKIWDLKNKSKYELIHTITTIKRRINSLAISDDGNSHNRILISGDSGNTIKIWGIEELLKNPKPEDEPSLTFTDHEDDVYSLAISSDNKFLVSGSADNTIKIWDLEKLKNKSKPYLTYTDHQGPVDTVAISKVKENDYIIVSGSSDNTIKVRHINNDNQKSIKNGCDIIHDYLTANKKDDNHLDKLCK